MAIYIYRDDGRYQPNSNTLLYFPLSDDLNDYSGNSITYITTGSPTITELNGVKCLYLNGSSAIDVNYSPTTTNITMICRFNRTSGAYFFLSNQPCGILNGCGMMIYDASTVRVETYRSSSTSVTTASGNFQNVWNHIALANGKLYVNGEYKSALSDATFDGSQPVCIGGHNVNSSCTRRLVTGYIGEVIMESGEMSAEDIAEHYNTTKVLYGIT